MNYKIPCIAEHALMLENLLNMYEKNVKTYTSSAACALNKCLRTQDVSRLLPRLECLHRRLMMAFNNSEPFKQTEPLYLYRGLKCNEILGKSFIDFGYVSTSISIDVAKDFSIDKIENVMQILLPGGVEYKMLPLESTTVCRGEFEILLPPNGYFHWCGQDDRGCHNYVYFAQKPDDSVLETVCKDVTFTPPPSMQDATLNQLKKEQLPKHYQAVMNYLTNKKPHLSTLQKENICTEYMFT